MKEKLTQFFDTDFHYVEVGVRKETDRQRISEMIWYARQRALGAVDMAQLCGLPYEEAERMFNEYGARLGVLENEVCGYWYQDEDEDYPSCHFDHNSPWPAPCEYDGEEDDTDFDYEEE